MPRFARRSRRTYLPRSPQAKRSVLSGGLTGVEVLLAVALGLIIIAALVLSIWHSSGSRSGADLSKDLLHFKCTQTQCGHELTITHSDLFRPPGMAGPDDITIGPYGRPNCPQCKAQDSGLPMVKCPNPDCGKYYIADTMKYSEAVRRGVDVRDICPYCKTDRAKWEAEHRKK